MTKYIYIQKKTHCYILPGPYPVAMTYAHNMKPVFKGKSFGPTIMALKDGVMHWYALEDKFKASLARAFELAKKDPDYIFRIRKKFVKIIPRLTDFTNQIFSQDLTKLSNQQLWRIMDKYIGLYLETYPWSEPITLGVEDSLGAYLKNYLKEILKTPAQAKSLTKIYNTLISPKGKSFVKREEDDLLKIVAGIQVHKSRKQFFTKGKVTAKKLKEKFPELYSKIKKHEASYCWVPYDYGVYLWDLNYFLKIIQDQVKARKAKAELVKSQNYYQSLVKEQRQFVKRLKIDGYHQKLFKVIRTCAFLLDYKKEQFTKSHYEIMKVLLEIAKRYNYTEKQIRLYTPAELKKALLKNNRLDKNRLKARSKFSVCYWYDGKFKIFEGSAARRFFQKNIQEEKESEVGSLNGIIASAGKYVGKVRIITHPKNLKDFRANEVLVTQMTSPDYVPAMKKAGAIITDKGGVTCHAAVVSRELGIPCVVGTQNATKVLKTGELIEVNANHNSVKILKK